MKKYFSYMLRIWLHIDSETPVWRASLEDPHTRKVIQFPHLAGLEAYLNELAASATPITPSHPQKESKER